MDVDTGRTASGSDHPSCASLCFSDICATSFFQACLFVQLHVAGIFSSLTERGKRLVIAILFSLGPYH